MKVQRLTVETMRNYYNFKLMLIKAFACRHKNIEYNTDTSAGHPVKDDDIVRYSLETRRVKNKES